MVELGEVLRLVQIAGLGHQRDRAGEHLASVGGVLLHLREFFVRQLAGLVEQRVADLDLAHVVQRRGDDDVLHELVGQLVG